MMNNKWRILLRPLSILYGWGVSLRHYLFDHNILKEQSYSIPIICVGNITVGGTGKTPHVEYLLRLLSSKYRVGLISRGYKRKTSGLVVAQRSSTAMDIGDEPKQILSKYPNTQLVIDGDRRRAMDYIMNLPANEKPDLVLMDDGFQHRYVKPTFSILLLDYSRLPINDQLLPEGQLRDSISQLYRANCVIVTKCPKNVNAMQRKIIERNLSLYPHQDLFFSTMLPLTPVPLIDLLDKNKKTSSIPAGAQVLALSGIAQGGQFVQQLAENYQVLQHISFDDHHMYTVEDIDKLNKCYEVLSLRYSQATIYCICTEKDSMRLLHHRNNLSSTLLRHLYYQPIEVRLLDNSAYFEQLILRQITSTKDSL